MSKPSFTDKQVSDFLAELKRQAARAGDPKVLRGLCWLPLEKIAGPEAFRVFFILEDRGLLRSEVIPGTFGHTVHHFTDAAGAQ